jgi:hypothetical protein
MAGINFHPAIGLGDLMPGWYAVPQNPIAAAKQGITKAPSLGDIVQGSYVVPQNPLANFVAGKVAPLGQKSGGGKGCGCGGSCGGCGSGGSVNGVGLSGTGVLSTDASQTWTDLSSGNLSAFFSDLGSMLTDPVPWALNAPLWGVAIAGYFAVNMLMGHEVTVSRRHR